MIDSNEFFTDEQIVNKVIKGNIESFSLIVDRYENIIYSLGMRLFKNYDDSVDFTQEVLIKSFEKLDRFTNKGQFKYWLIKLAYNHGLNKLKSIKKTSRLENNVYDDNNNVPDRLHIKHEISDILIAEINKLPDEYRICLDFYFFLSLSYKGISEITRIPVNTIKSNVYRAKKLLHNRLKGTIAEDYDEM